MPPVIFQGRKGKGCIFVRSAGNGGIVQDSCAYDDYVNNIYSISVSSLSKKNQPLRASERCSAIMVAAYSKDKGDTNVPVVSRSLDLFTPIAIPTNFFRNRSTGYSCIGLRAFIINK